MGPALGKVAVSMSAFCPCRNSDGWHQQEMGSGSLIYCQEVNLPPFWAHFEPVVHRAAAGVMASSLRTVGSSRFSAFQIIA
jgi:hypothetical protein